MYFLSPGSLFEKGFAKYPFNFFKKNDLRQVQQKLFFFNIFTSFKKNGM